MEGINQMFWQHYSCLHQSIADEGSHSVAEILDLFFINLASVFSKVIMALPSHSGLYCYRELTACRGM